MHTNPLSVLLTVGGALGLAGVSFVTGYLFGDMNGQDKQRQKTEDALKAVRFRGLRYYPDELRVFVDRGVIRQDTATIFAEADEFQDKENKSEAA